jgi:molecular chaperone IbpA
MVTFNWETYTPYSIGLDETFSRLEALAGSGSSYPPYNVVNGDDGRTVLEVALAGFTSEEIEVSTERHVLTVAATKSKEDKERKYQHKGISQRSFARNWQMAEDVEVENVEFKDGLLTIVLRKELPEKQKKKKWF